MRQLSLGLDGRAGEGEPRAVNGGGALVVCLAGESIEALAVRLAELVSDRAGTGRLIDAQEVARRYGVSRAFVYEHADEVGAIRVGAGPRPRLRFDAATVGERLVGASPASRPPTRARDAAAFATRRQRDVATDARDRLLPIRGASQPSSGTTRRRHAASKQPAFHGRNTA